HEHIVITDFGIAKNTQINQELTQHGVVVGSPSYSSPEQAQCQEIDHRSDLYSVGVIFVEMLLGYNPYRGENYTQTVVNHVQMDIPTLPQELSPYQAIVNKLLAKQPDQRFSDSQSLVNAIDGLLTVSIPIYSPTVSTQKKSVSKQKVIVGVVAILLFLLALITAPMVKKYWQVRQLLQQAEQRLQQKKWLSPANDSAQFFYQQALNLDADNQQAKTGLTTAKNQQIAYWLTQAETKFASGDLSTPKDDNAVFYFQQIQTIDAKQPQAQAGLQRIAQVYLGLAQEDYQQKQFEQALNAIKLGLLAQPDHSELLKLAAEHEQRVAAANQKSTKTSPQNTEKKPSKNKQSSNNGLQKFWKKLWGN
ncbi:MAG TPA: protein kinase, partial [Agitococcus sp.]|nr:protein kinase [Agitococcus sp.]